MKSSDGLVQFEPSLARRCHFSNPLPGLPGRAFAKLRSDIRVTSVFAHPSVKARFNLSITKPSPSTLSRSWAIGPRAMYRQIRSSLARSWAWHDTGLVRVNVEGDSTAQCGGHYVISGYSAAW